MVQGACQALFKSDCLRIQLLGVFESRFDRSQRFIDVSTAFHGNVRQGALEERTLWMGSSGHEKTRTRRV
jgi:hypothetical protein